MSSSTPPPLAPSPPDIPGLELQEAIGEGGTSVVYRAVHRTLQRTVAVKLMRGAPDGPPGPDWLRESRLLASLAHPHVVAIHDAGQAGGHSYLVLEYAAGGALRARMTPDRPWPLAEAAALLDRIARALAHIHGRGVLHLDLKPENILYAADGRIKIADFGLAVPHADATALAGGRRFQGTLDYCAPESRSGLAPDGRFDVFSLAAVAYELLTGRVPGRVYVPASRRNPGLPAALDDVLRRGTARNPDERYASVEEFRRALAAACRPPAGRVPLRLLGVLAGLAALVVVPLVAHIWQPTPPQLASAPPPDADRPDRLVVLYDQPDDLSYFAAVGGGELAGEPAVPVERVRVENPPSAFPAGLPLPVWPTPRPVLVVRSPRAWGFVYPFRDRSLGWRVVAGWPDLLRAVVPPDRNLVRAGGFDGDCLAKNHGGDLWRVGDAAGWDATRQITLDRPADQPVNPCLLLTGLSPARDKGLLGCYQPLRQGPPPGATLVLRYRAKSLHGKGSLAVYAGMPAPLPEGEAGPAAARIRAAGTRLPPGPGDPGPDRWLYRSPTWVVPPTEWQTYLVVLECPPFPTQALHRNLVIDLGATGPAAGDQVRVDDVELFVWPPGGAP